MTQSGRIVINAIMMARTEDTGAPPMKATITVHNVNHPEHLRSVDARKYTAMKAALSAILPRSAPGLTQKDMLAAVKTVVDQEVFPNGEKSGWWAKTVQLDLEAKGEIVRVTGTPLRWYMAP